jgi:hypothetical protein
MSISQNASLVLCTNNGTSNTNKTSTTWNNINLRTLLGDMYDKYDMFNLCLNTVSTSTSTNNIYKSFNDSNVIIRVSGIPFINNSYNIGSLYNSNTNYATIGTFQFGTTVINPSSTFQGSIALNSATLTVPSGTLLATGSVIAFYDPNLNAYNTKTIVAPASATTYTLNSVIGATAVGTTTINVYSFTSATQYFYGSNIATFGKNQDVCNLTIDYLRVSDLIQPETFGTNTFPNTTFIFDIFGIEKDKGNLNGTRL